MAIWIQSLSWALIYGLGQGVIVYEALWLVLKLSSGTSSNARYHLSLSAMAILLAWFIATWWQQFHQLSLVGNQLFSDEAGGQVNIALQIPAVAVLAKYPAYHSLLSSVSRFFPWLSVGYFVGLMLMLVRLSSGMLHLFSFKRKGTSTQDSALDTLLETLKKQINFTGSVRLLISAKAKVPMVIGCLKPIILMPAAAMAQLSTEQLETILLHELAHIKRYDYLVNILQTIVETILFFNPFVWMISAGVRREREHCCDDVVLDHTREPLLYATALVAIARNYGSNPALAMAATGQSAHLFNRIKRIMEMKKNTFSYSGMIAAIFLIIAIVGSVAWFTPSIAKGKKDNTVTINKGERPELNQSSATDDKGLGKFVQQMVDDHVIDESKGFTIVKRMDTLYIDGLMQEAELARRYLPLVKQDYVNVQVYPFRERLMQHSQSGLLQLISPVKSAAGCVQYSTGKPKC